MNNPDDKSPPPDSGTEQTTAMGADQRPDLPERIGPYRILSLLGKGGFGVVYLAEQTTPVRRRVALKVIKPGMDSAAVVARFEAERQALAVMDHPCVAHVFDAGSTSEGRPFFVMELVKGVPITAHCDRQRLTVRQRVELFIQVCEAVQHAHMKGVIHRDLKPSNILVEYSDDSSGSGMTPKVIDFGVAKSLDHPLTDKTLFTAVGELVGTPEYMSPEQAGTSGQDIDTRADIYALGVVLYELLVGQVPFDVALLRKGGIGEVLRVLHEVEPLRPSAWLSATGRPTSRVGVQAPPEPGERLTIADQRRLDVRGLARALKGDLDWIILKCLEKDRARRYETANALATDLRRYLRQEPVLAGPPGAAYRIGKFVRRHRVPVAAAAVTALTLLAAVIGVSLALNEARIQRSAAERAQVEATERANELEQVAKFQSSLLGELDPERIGHALLQDMTVRLEQAEAEGNLPPAESERLRQALENVVRYISPTDVARRMLDETLLVRAVAAIEQEFSEQPLVEAALRQTVGEVYGGLGLFPSALEQLERAYAIRSHELGSSHRDTLRARAALGLFLLNTDQIERALEHLEATLTGFRELAGPGDPDAIGTAITLAVALRRLNRLDEAMALGEEAHAAALASAGPDDSQTLHALNNLGVLYQMTGDWQKAETYFRQALDGRLQVFGEENAETLVSYQNVGLTLWAQYRLDEAEPFLQNAVRLARRIHGEDHPTTLQFANSLGVLLHTQGNNEEAEQLLTTTLESYRRVLGPLHYESLTCLANLASVFEAQGQMSRAEHAYRDAMNGFRDTAGVDDRNTLIQMSNLGLLLADEGELADAEALLSEAVDLGLKALGEIDDVLIWINNLASIKRDLGLHEASLALAVQAVEGAKKNMPPVYQARFQMTQARALNLLGRYPEATRTMEMAHAVLAEALGPDSDWALEAATEVADFYSEWARVEPEGGHEESARQWQANAGIEW